MAAFLCMRMIKGHLIYNQVPESLRQQVADQLRAQGREDLISAEEVQA